MSVDTLAVVGVGLIGGSIGLAAKKRGVARRVLGVGRARDSLERARAIGAIDDMFLDVEPAARQADFMIFATPVDRIAGQIVAAARACAPATLLTDAGSTKEQIVTEVEKELTPGVYFVGSHPLAGSEKRGPEFASAELFQDRWTVITPTPRTPDVAVEKTRLFWTDLGCRVKLMSPEEHDRALALTSHLPHLLASALAGILPPEMFDLAASGFRDTTRVAASDPPLWTAIFAHNRPAIREALVKFNENLNRLGQALDEGDWKTLDSLLNQSKKVRDALGS